MKSIALFGFALAMSPALVAAQTNPSPDAASWPHPPSAAMQQLHAQMEQIHKQARAQMLASLTPAHRAALANIVGQLAVSPNPDRAGAARSLDALLSPAERTSVLSVESNARTQSHGLMEAARAQYEASLTPDQKAAMDAKMAAREAAHPAGAMRPAYTPDPGRTLIELATGGGEHRGFGGPGGPPPPQ